MVIKQEQVQRLIGEVCEEIKSMLIEKNTAYGNSAIDPVRIFSKASAEEQINVRMDDKLSRIMRGKDTDKVPEKTEEDLIGYLILKEVARRVRAMKIIRNASVVPAIERKVKTRG